VSAVTDTLTVGDVTLTRVVEIPRSFYPTREMLPESSPDAIARHREWLAPFWDDTVGDLGSRIQSWVVRTPTRTIVVDTCVGNDKPRHESPLWHLRHGSYLDDLAAAGVTPGDVDLVVCTHLHVDHVGWNTRLVDGRWTPTFPRATYLIVGDEWEFWRHESRSGREPSGCIEDSVVPIVDAGLVKLVDATHVIGEGLAFEPWPGHTPGHACVRLTTRAGDVVFAGDLMHRVVQVAEPRWNSRFCYDGAAARASREAFVERHADSGAVVLPAHFPAPGRIVRERTGFRFVPLPVGA
jgi:glyoxylase-like metal-dependent hydrolase (beta-lactamase superfamily II)